MPDTDNIVIEREDSVRYDLRRLAAGEFSIRLVIGIRNVRLNECGWADWCIELWLTESGEEFFVPPILLGDRHSANQYWVLTDGGTCQPLLCPYDQPFDLILPSARWTKSLWSLISEKLAGYLGYDALSERRACLAPRPTESSFSFD